MSSLPITTLIIADTLDASLQGAINSVAWSQEVVVITTTDQKWQTLTGVTKILPYPQALTDFAQLRNWALSQAQQEWVLFLDSDEIMPSGADKILTPLVKRHDLAGILLERQDIFLGKKLQWGESGQTEVLRLMRKRQAHFRGKVHEAAHIKGRVISLPLVITHRPHDSIGAFLAKIITYSRLAAEEKKQRGEVFQIWELLLFPPGKFVWNYFFKLGLFDGWRGFIYAVMMSIHSVSVRICLYELHHQA